MKQEAIQALEMFKHMHLAGNGQADTMSESPAKPKRVINYPKHVKPLQERIMSAVGNGCRTSQAITTYCGEDTIKVVNMHLGRLLSADKLIRYTNPDSGITRYYTPDEAKAKGYKPDAQPKKAKKDKKADRALAPIRAKEKDYIAFLENRVTAWAQESRKQAHEITKLQDALIEARKTRDVTSEVTEVMQEVTKLRATVAYLESKLFGSK